MSIVRKITLPSHALLNHYTSMEHTYTDCYVTDLPIQITFSEYLFAFYTTPLFKLERLILLLVRKPSTNKEARDLADGTRQAFAAWTVEARSENQILMCDFMSRTRSWLMIESTQDGTRLYFGSAVVPEKTIKSKIYPLGLFFHALLGFHKIYSVMLLYAARSRLLQRGL